MLRHLIASGKANKGRSTFIAIKSKWLKHMKRRLMCGEEGMVHEEN